MKKFLTLLLSVLMTISLFAGCSGENAETTEQDTTAATQQQATEPTDAGIAMPDINGVFSVGYGIADITPRENVSLAGFSDANERISNAVMDPIYTTCTAITDEDGTTILLFGLDLLHTYEVLSNNIRKLLEEKFGIPGDHVMFFASHTHSSLNQTNDAPEMARANELFKEQCVAAAEQALADRKPAKMEATFSRPEYLNYRRHYVLSDGTYQAYHLGEVDNGKIYGHLGMADNLLQMVKFTREGGCDVMMINWQAHYASATDQNYYGISADYPGVLRNELRSQLGCETIFFLGGSGNVTSGTRIKNEPDRENYIEQGKALAAEVVKASGNFKPLSTGKIVVTRNDYVFEGTTKVHPLYTLGFGEWGCAFGPFEIFDMHAQSVRENSPYKYTFYASCANSSKGNSYLPHEASFDYYCYEADVTKYAKGAGEALRDELTKMIRETFTASGQEPQTREEGYIEQPYVPKTNGKTYVNPAPGSLPVTEGQNGYLCMTVLLDGKMAPLLFKDRALAERVATMDTFRLLFDDYNTVVGIVE